MVIHSKYVYHNLIQEKWKRDEIVSYQIQQTVKTDMKKKVIELEVVAFFSCAHNNCT